VSSTVCATERNTNDPADTCRMEGDIVLYSTIGSVGNVEIL